MKRWVESMSEADGIYVLDTGSDDKSEEILRSLGVNVTREVISPWRFDEARNRALELVPEDADLCVCTDLDEVFHLGWREKMETALDKGATLLKYRYTWSFLPNGQEGYVFWIEKAHARSGFKWVNPVHEVLKSEISVRMEEAKGVQLDHLADEAKSRAQYLPLLELAVKEDPTNDRNMHYLGREYMFYGRWRECESTLKKHLEMPSATWNEERCASMRYIARAVKSQGRETEAELWRMRAIAEAPHLREPWLEAAEDALHKKRWSGALYFAQRALEITERGRSYINEAESWGAKPYDIAALSSYYLGLYRLAFDFGKTALSFDKNDKRLLENMVFYEKAIRG